MTNVAQAETLDKLRGMLVGLAVGDALGAIYEFYSANNLAHLKTLKMRTINRTTGIWTDDTAMALCLADSLIENNGYDSFDVMNKYLDWHLTGYRSYFSCGEGIGIQTAGSIISYKEGHTIIPANKQRTSNAGNGALMRLAPVVIAAYGKLKPQDVLKLARISARETHYSQEAEATAEIFAYILYKAVKNPSKEDIVDITDAPFSSAVNSSVLNRINARYSHKELVDLGGYSIDALKIAIWGFLNYDNFKSGINAVIKLGGDTDTNGAIYGQLAGAYYGYSAIPLNWRNNLYQEQDIVFVADSLATMPTCPILQTRFEEDNY